jgi:preprotein translocase subunit YajC
MSAEFVRLFVTWLPLIVIFVIWLLIGVVFLYQRKQYKKVIEVNEALFDVNRDMAASLRNIEELLKDRKH